MLSSGRDCHSMISSITASATRLIRLVEMSAPYISLKAATISRGSFPWHTGVESCIHRGETDMMLLDQQGLKAAFPIAWGVQVKLTIPGPQRLDACAIAAFEVPRSLVPGIDKMLIKFGIQSRLNRRLRQDPSEIRLIIEILLAFNSFCHFTGKSFQFFLSIMSYPCLHEVNYRYLHNLWDRLRP